MMEFFFRVYLYPNDPADVEVFCYELEPLNYNERSGQEWAEESLREQDLYEFFDLDKNKYWQAVGKATITGWTDYFGEYDEMIEIDEFHYEEIPEDVAIGAIEEQNSRLLKFENTVERDIEKRWEKGMPHHPKSVEIYKAISYIDNKYNNYYFDWNGGNGSDGEELMYELDVYFECLDTGEELWQI